MNTEEVLSLIPHDIQILEKEIHELEDEIRLYRKGGHELFDAIYDPKVFGNFLETSLEGLKSLRSLLERAASSPNSPEFKRVMEMAEDRQREIASLKNKDDAA